jgi:acylphosphatase
MAEARAELLISGRVQGVWYRGGTVDMARPLGLTGMVRNLSDGRVEAVFEGPKERVEQAIEWCRKGPTGSRVSDVQVVWAEPRGSFGDFRIEY